MRVEVKLIVRLAICGALMEAHRVGKRGFEEVVIARGEALHNVGQAGALGGFHLIEAAEVTFGQDHGFEGPDGPEGDERDEQIVLADQPACIGLFALEVFAEEAAGVMGSIVAEGCQFLFVLVGQRLV